MSAELTDFDFSNLEPITKRVLMPDGKRFLVTEVTAGANMKFKDALLKGVRMGDNGKPVSAEGLTASEVQLVADCLVPCDGNWSPKLSPTGDLQSAEVRYVQRLPDRISSRLLAWIKANSEAFQDLGEEGADAADGEGGDSPKAENSSNGSDPGPSDTTTSSASG